MTPRRASPVVWWTVLVLFFATIFIVRIHDEMVDLDVYLRASTRAWKAANLYRPEDGHYQFKYLPAFAFPIRPLASLQKLPASAGVMVIVDGVYSMEGDIADLPALIKVCQKYGAALVVDDAHSVGVLGPNGQGTAAHFDVTDEVDLIVDALRLGSPSRALGKKELRAGVVESTTLAENARLVALSPHLGDAVNLGDVVLVLDERLAIQRLDLVGNGDGRFAPRREVRLEHFQRIGRRSAGGAGQDLARRLVKLPDLGEQALDLSLLAAVSHHRLIIIERHRHDVIRGLDLFPVGGKSGRIGFEQRVADGDRARQHLRAQRREQFLRARVPGGDLGRFPLHPRDGRGKGVARVNPQPERHAEAKRQGGAKRHPLDLIAAHDRILSPARGSLADRPSP